MVAITFRTTGVWGAGSGADLTAVQIDTNFYNLKNAVEALQTNPTEPNQIANIVVENNQITFVMEDATEFGPYDLPIAEFSDRGEFDGGLTYFYGDIFTSGLGLYMSLQEHTTVEPFDPAASNGFGPLYRTLFDGANLAWSFLEDGYPVEGEPLEIFDVFSVPDDGVYLVLQDHDALAAFDPDAVNPDDDTPYYQKIFQAIETAIARIQFQYPGTFPADSSLMFKLIQDDPRNLEFAAGMGDSIAHLEVAVTAALSFPIMFEGAEVGSIDFEPGALLDGDGGQFATFTSDGFTVAQNGLIRIMAPDTTDTTARFLSVALVGSYVTP